MVGVPRSKGCRICVQRRVKCDQTRPVCLRCLKGNRPCPGYEQGMKFQDEGPRLRQHFEKPGAPAVQEQAIRPDQPWRDASPSVSSGTSSSSSTDADSHDMTAVQVPTRDEPSGWATVEHSDLVLLGKENWLAHRPTQSTPAPESGDDRALSMQSLLKFFDSSPFQSLSSPLLQQQQLLYTFMSSMSSTARVELSIAFRSHANWLAYLPPLFGSNPLLDNAVRACTLAHMGRLNNADYATHEAQAYYGRALRLLGVTLQDANKGMSSETLSATILLSFYEMLASDSDQSWVRHAGGASTLMKMRGPARHRTGFDREIFLAYRYALVISAFEADAPSFLEEPEWRQLSRQIYDDMCTSGVVGNKLDVFDAAECFFQEMVPLPGLVSQARKMAELASKTNTDLKTIAKHLCDRANSHRTGLKGSYVRFRAALKRLGHEPSSRMSGDWVFPVCYEYTNVFTGGICTGYWTVLIVVNLTLKELDPASERAVMFRSENAETAREICRSATWMSTSSFLGPFILTFALRVSLLVLEDDTQRTWVIQQLKKLGATRLAIASHIPVQ